MRNQEILAALKDEPMTAFDIAGHITWMLEFGGVHFNDLASPDRRMAVSETLAHLEAMRVNGRVVRTDRDEIIYYRHA